MKKAFNTITDLLPNYFKTVGVALIIISICVSVIAKLYVTDLTTNQKEIFKNVGIGLIILGLFFVAWAKNKVADEMSVQIRLQSASNAFSFAVFYTILMPFSSLVFNDGELLSGQELIMSMLVLHLITTFFQSRKIK